MIKTIKLQCNYCKKIFKREKHRHQHNLNRNTTGNTFCTAICQRAYNTKIGRQYVNCCQCNKRFSKRVAEIKKAKNDFCSSSCAATYNNTHKTYGTRRSKLECYLEEQITTHFSNLKLLCNNKEIINSELDFYFPDLKFAIEVNGIFHYKPIYGEEKLKKIQINDRNKTIKCLEKGIKLFIIDSSTCTFLSKKAKDDYWKITNDVINKHIIS